MVHLMKPGPEGNRFKVRHSEYHTKHAEVRHLSGSGSTARVHPYFAAFQRSRAGLSLMFIAVLFASCVLMPAVSFPASRGDVIREIEVEGLTRIPDRELKDIMCFKLGMTMDREALQESIRRAFAKGIFYDIRAVSEPIENGVRLKYIVKEIPVVKSVVIEGNREISGRSIKRALPFREDEDYREEYLGKAEKDILGLYRRKGFEEASVEITAADTDRPSEVTVTVSIEEGKPTVISAVHIPNDLRGNFRIRDGAVYDRDAVENEIKRLQHGLKEDDYINPVIGPYAYSDGVLSVPVKKGQRLKMNFRGNSSVADKKLRAEVPFFDDEEVTDENVKEAIDRMRNVYLAKGYYHVQIAAGVESSDDIITITFIVHEGQKVILKKANFEGAVLSSEVLMKLIPFREDKIYNDTLVEDAQDSIVRFYNALGYMSAEVTGVRKELSQDGAGIELTFMINEGLQTRISRIEITGNRDIEAREVMNAAQLREGSPYNVIDIGDARYRILSLYGKRGYVDAGVDVESMIDGKNASIVFRIKEGKPSVIGKVIYRGNRKTKTKIIEREFTISEGDPYNYEELIATKQRLYKLGIFSEIAIESLEPKDDGDRRVRDILVSLREGKAGSVELSVGYGDYEKFRGALDINYRNIGGYNRQVGLRTEVSSVEERYVLSFREPRLFNIPDFPFSALLIGENTRSVNLDTNDVLYEVDRLSLILGVEKELKKKWKANLSYEFSAVDTHDVAPGVILSRDDTGRINIGSITPALFYDTRDDPFDPTKGVLHGIVVKVAARPFFSETSFIKATAQSSWFFPLPKKIVFALSARGGVAYSLDNIKELPLVERFFLGGRTTVRGYNNDTLGPKGDDGSPTGGNIFVLCNNEFRIPIGKGFGLVTFVDAGNVWKLVEDINDELKFTAGAGLRYKTPVGPISIDYGHKLNRERGESAGEVHFSFGHAF